MRIVKYNILRVWLITLFKRRIKIEQPQRIDKNVRIHTDSSGLISIGKGCHVLRNTTIQSDSGNIQIGKGTFINENVKIVSRKSIRIGDNCSIGPNTVIYDHDHDYRCEEGGFVSSEIVIGSHVWIGANAIILRGTKIGDNCVIAAGAVVKESITANHLFVRDKQMEIKKI